jgi:tRNA U55 pseudouridine synthase TruB
MTIILVNKPIGWTMLDLIQHFKHLYPDNKLSFSGRLDPMAFGQVKLLIDEDVKNNISESDCYKTYRFNFIENILTDTYDILGIPKISNSKNFNLLNTGWYEQEYPPFSSVIIKEHNLPYWQCMRRGLIVKNKPTKHVEIKDIKILSNELLTKDVFLKEIKSRFNLLTKFTFRQDEIYEKWEDLDFKQVNVIKMEATISSGCYIRWICNEMNGCAYDIERIKYI